MASSRAARPLITSPLGVARLYAGAAAAAASSAGGVAAASAPAPTAGAASERRVPPTAGRRQHDMSDLTRQAGNPPGPPKEDPAMTTPTASDTARAEAAAI